MIGAILGDIIGSPYEFDRGDKSAWTACRMICEKFWNASRKQ